MLGLVDVQFLREQGGVGFQVLVAALVVHDGVAGIVLMQTLLSNVFLLKVIQLLGCLVALGYAFTETFVFLLDFIVHHLLSSYLLLYKTYLHLQLFSLHTVYGVDALCLSVSQD